MARSITVIPARQTTTGESETNQMPQLQRMAAYCRVSTDNEEQLLSYENQVRYYTEYINNSPLYKMAGIYADEGISATNTKKRENFNRMIKDCREGKIDMIITKPKERCYSPFSHPLPRMKADPSVRTPPGGLEDALKMDSSR